jgi:hypothetical protein
MGLLYSASQKIPLGIKKWIKPYFYRIALLLVSDELYVKTHFKWTFKRDLDLNNPQTFSEKIQYLKLYNRTRQLNQLADKYEVRQYVKDQGLDHLLNHLIGIYQKTEEINLDKLPESFVIKPTHGSGWVILCKDKSTMNWKVEFDKLRGWMRSNFYMLTREWIYKDINPRIIIEDLLQNKDGSPLKDYKIFCFNGKPTYIQVDMDRFANHRRNIYDLDWTKLPCELLYKNYDGVIPRPANLDDMVEIARKLSAGLIFCRVDLYSIDEKIVFGEITFTPGNGLKKFVPAEYDLVFGRQMDLSPIKR